jgi:hypothetical protein
MKSNMPVCAPLKSKPAPGCALQQELHRSSTVGSLPARKPALLSLRVGAVVLDLAVAKREALTIGIRIRPRTPTVTGLFTVPSKVIDIGVGLPWCVLKAKLGSKSTSTLDLQVLRQALHIASIPVVVERAARCGPSLGVLPVEELDVLDVFVAVALELNAALVYVVVRSVCIRILVVVASQEVRSLDLPSANLFLSHPDLPAVLRAVRVRLAVLNLGLVCSPNLGPEIHTEEVITGLAGNKISKLPSERTILTLRHAAQTVLDSLVVELGLLGQRWWPFVTIVSSGGWVTELLAEREVGAHASARGLLRVSYLTSTFSAVLVVLAVLVRTNVCNQVCVWIITRQTIDVETRVVARTFTALTVDLECPEIVPSLVHHVA